MKNPALNQNPIRNPFPVKPNFQPTNPNQFQNLYRPANQYQTNQFQTNQFRNNVPRPTYSQFQRQPQPHAKPSSFKFAKTSAQQLEKRQPRQQPMDIDPSLSRMRQQTPFGPAPSRPHAKPSSFKFAKTSAQQLEKRQPRQQPMDIDPSLSRMRQQTPFGPAPSRNRFHVEELHQQEEEGSGR
ncbi:hypothetical protein QE152_g1182 [Popillia japonica]|uniref:Uncharacterized protein n=1 Tax=Popillia japonica TaxID=7064 RepID=A0AAW1N5T0_POPJA